MKYWLENVEQRAARTAAFGILPLERRARLPANCSVKVVFTDARGQFGEPVWVKVKLAVADGDRLRYHGTIEQSLKLHALERGTRIVFGPEHVLDIMLPLVEGC